MFQRLIEEVIEAGLTESDIGQRVDASQASINRIKLGSQNPKYDLGVALVALHEEVVIRQVRDRRTKERRAADRREAAAATASGESRQDEPDEAAV